MGTTPHPSSSGAANGPSWHPAAYSHRPRPGVPAPDSTDEHAAAIFRQQGRLCVLPRQALLYAPGEPAAHAYLVQEGEVRVTRCTAEGRELTLHHAGTGDVLGETELLLGTARETQAQARTQTRLYALPAETLQRQAERDPAFGLWLSRVLGARQAHLEQRLERLLFTSAPGRVAQVLVNLAARYGRPTGQGTLIDYPITHQEIGSLIATTRETVSYAFMDFRSRGFISTARRRTIVHDLAALEAAAAG